MSRIISQTAGDLINTPGLIFESLYRDHIKTEMELEIATVSGSDISMVMVNGNVYASDSILVNVTRNEEFFVSAYDDNVTLTVNGTPTGWATGDQCYLKNVNVIIDADSIDVLDSVDTATGTTTSTSAGKLVDTGASFLTTAKAGQIVKNTTDTTYTYIHSVDSNTTLTLENDIFTSGEGYLLHGKRKGWLLGKCFTEQQDSRTVLKQLMYETHCILTKSYDKLRIIDLQNGNTVGTLTTPARQNGRPLVSAQLTPRENIFTQFTLNYDWDYSSQTYRKKISVSKNSSSNAYLSDLETVCAAAEADYKVKNLFEYSADYIHDDDTANMFLECLVNWFTYQRLIVYWTGDVKNHILYEKGDRVKIDFNYMMPVGVNNLSQFMIVNKTIDLKKKVVSLTLFY
jgi:hypothetical protein